MTRSPLLALLALSLVACTTATPDRRTPRVPGPDAPVSVRATLTLDGGALGLEVIDGVIEPHAPLYVMDAGPWPKGGTARTPPITAVVTRDGAGAVWILHDRRGSSLGRAQVSSDIPATSLYPRPAVSRGLLSGGDVQAGDQVVIVAHSDGPIMGRIIGAGRYDGERWVWSSAVQGGGLSVRVGWLPPEIEAEMLVLRPVEGDCVFDGLEGALASVPGVSIEPDNAAPTLSLVPVDCEATPPRFHLRAPSGSKLLRSPFWNPGALSISGDQPGTLAAILAAFRGERALALALAASHGVGTDSTPTLVAAALALEVGWSTDTIALLDGWTRGADSPEAALLRAGALYQLGDREAALAVLSGARGGPTSDGRSDLTARLATARAAITLSLQRPGDAVSLLDAAIVKSTDADRSTLQLARAEILLAMGDLRGFDTAIDQIAAQGGAAQGATLKRYQAMLARMKGGPEKSMALYKEGIALARKARDWRQVAIMSLFCAEIASELHPEEVADFFSGAEEAARRGFDASSWSEARLARWEAFAIKQADGELDKEISSALMESAIGGARGVDRLDREARARRYSLLALPPQADISFKARALKAALIPALASRELVEATILLSLMAQVEAARFSFEEAELLLTEARAFAVVTGDGELVKMIDAERELLK